MSCRPPFNLTGRQLVYSATFQDAAGVRRLAGEVVANLAQRGLRVELS